MPPKRRKKKPTAGSNTAAKRSANAMRKAAEKLRQKAAVEYKNKVRCVELEREVQTSQVSDYPLTSPTGKYQSTTNGPDVFSIGDYAQVTSDLSPGKCSYGGTGFIVDITKKNKHFWCSVRYDQNSTGEQRTEKDIPASRLTIIPYTAFRTGRMPSRKRNKNITMFDPSPDKAATSTPDWANMPLVDALSLSFSSGRGKGWRNRDMHKLDSNEKEEKLLSDVQVLKSFIEGQTRAGISPPNLHSKTAADGTFKKRTARHIPWSIRYLMYAWGRGKNYSTKLLKRTRQTAKATESDTNKRQQPKVLKAKGNASYIVDRERGRRFYNARYFYVKQYVETRMDEERDLFSDAKAKRLQLMARAKQCWNTVTNQDTIQLYEARAREHDKRQPFVQDEILALLKGDPSLSFEKLSESIGGWCSASAIQSWLASQLDYCKYVERLLPLLSTQQMQKHVAFARHYRNRWGLPPGKYLLIHYDEKWFWGFVQRANAKMCEALGLGKHLYYMYHKNHVDKLMIVCFVGYAFDGSMENGGHGLKLGMLRVQAAKIAKKLQRESTRDANHNLHYDGKILREKGDAYMVDCNVTGSNQGTSADPKFSLKALLEDAMFPHIESLVGEGGAYEGYIPIIQGDNAGPHQDTEFLSFCEQFCESRGWHWEPQAPQMPHMNNLDLAVFPSMSHRHSTELRKRGAGQTVSKEDIWKACETVWTNLPSATIARGFALSYRVADQVIKHNGKNSFLQSADFHSNVRKDYYDTAKGIRKKATAI